MPIQTDKSINLFNNITNCNVVKVFSNVFYVALLILVAMYITIMFVEDEMIPLCRNNIRSGVYIFLFTTVILSVNNSIICNNVKQNTEKLNNNEVFNNIYTSTEAPNIIRTNN